MPANGAFHVTSAMRKIAQCNKNVVSTGDGLFNIELQLHRPLRIQSRAQVPTSGDGHDGHDHSGSLSGNLQTGPFHIEGAMPGDTIAVHFNRIKPNGAPRSS
jgi:acetamidase/formamidase